MLNIKTPLCILGMLFIFSCRPALEKTDDTTNSIRTMTVTTPARSMIADGDTIELPAAARTGTAIYYPPAEISPKHPVIMVPGLGLSDYIFTATPDDRESWAAIFSEAGYPAYVYNDPSLLLHEGIDYDSLNAEGSKWTASKAWSTWGMGPTYPEPFPNTRYPVAGFDELVASFPTHTNFSFLTPPKANETQTGRGRGGGGGGGIGTRIKVDNLLALLAETGPAVLMVHSASGTTGFEAAKAQPELVKALVAIEPVGAPSDPDELARYFTDIPVLGVYGDFVEQRRQTGRKEALQAMIDFVDARNVPAKMLDLPARGIAGNTHLLMQDDNNGEIADMVIAWISKLP